MKSLSTADFRYHCRSIQGSRTKCEARGSACQSKGDTELGQLNSAESRVRLAEINAAQAETDFARTQKLYNDKLISAEEYEKGEVSVKQAREELQTAKDNLEIVKEGITKNSASFSSTLIRSTITGLILDVPNQSR